MSIKGNQRNPNRDRNDFYPTDPRWTEALLNAVDIRGPIWECAAGEHHMSDVLKERGFEVRETDITTGTDFLLETEPWQGSIVTNPPFRFSSEFIERGLALAEEQLALLFSVGVLSGKGRYRDFWSVTPPTTVVAVIGSMPIVGGTKSQFQHIWVVWDKRRTGEPTQLVWQMA